MSKYRVVIHPSVQRIWFVAGFYLLLLAAIWSCPGNVFPAQTWLAAILTGGLLVIAWRDLSHKQSQSAVVLVSEQGTWQIMGQGSDVIWHLSRHSRVSPWALFLLYESSLPNQKPRKECVFKDQFSEQDYRRLCRIIYQLNDAAHNTEQSHVE